MGHHGNARAFVCDNDITAVIITSYRTVFSLTVCNVTNALNKVLLRMDCNIK